MFGNQSGLFSVEGLKNKNINAVYKNFPDRTTEIGNVINSYLKSMVRTKFCDKYIYLNFLTYRAYYIAFIHSYR